MQLYVSKLILSEYERVLGSSKFGFSRVRIRSVLSRLRDASHPVDPVRILAACPHDDDNRFLECADAAGANFLITGNQRHFPARWKQTQIVNARQFLERTVLIRT